MVELDASTESGICTERGDRPTQSYVAELAKASYAEEKKLEDLPTAFIEASPNAEDGLVVGTLGIDGGEVDPILNFVNEIAAGMHGDVDSLLIAYKGKLLFESLKRTVNYPHTRCQLPSPTPPWPSAEQFSAAT